MCGIAGYYNTQDATEKTRHSLLAMANRGKEAAGLWTRFLVHAKTPDELPHAEGTQALGHILHAMVGCVPQPLQGKGVLVANCEIYNWQQLAEQESIIARNDADVLLHILDKYYPDINVALERLEGVYAFAYEREGTVTITRDILGVKPLFYSNEHGFAFASEKKALAGHMQVSELNPRQIISYNIQKNSFETTQKEFFTIIPEHDSGYELQRAIVTALLEQAVEKRIPDAKFGLLLSGGVDSSTIALLLQKHKPHCYVVGDAITPDAVAASSIAAHLGLELTIVSPSNEEMQAALPEIMAAIEDSNPVKVSVALTFWFACKQAAKDGCRALFSGLGAEELFAGYERHRKSTEPNKECLAGLRKMHERDLYRDDVVTMRFGIELRLPFLDKALVEYSLRIPAKYKLWEGIDKRILRDAAFDRGVPGNHAYREKKAAQYGSRMMHRLKKLAGKQSIADYLTGIYGKRNKRLAALVSTGKDSLLALHIMHDMQYHVSCCITIHSHNPDSYMYHSPNTSLAQLQADAMRLPLLTAETEGEKEKELDALKTALQEAKARFQIEGVIVGAIQSQYQRERVEKIADELGLTTFAPLWQMDQEHELRMLLKRGFSVIFVRVAAEGLDASWLGKHLDNATIEALLKLHAEKGVHPAGEGGEYESLVLDAPLFHEKLHLTRTETIKDGSAATLAVQEAKLVPK